MPKKKTSKGRARGHTAMGHARRWVKQRWPGARNHEAKPSTRWIPDPDPCPACKRGVRPQVEAHDLFGCFDLMLLDGCRLRMIQVTTGDDDDSASARRSKIGRWCRKWLREDGDLRGLRDVEPGSSKLPLIEIWRWEPRKHFHVWRWSWLELAWGYAGTGKPRPEHAKP